MMNARSLEFSMGEPRRFSALIRNLPRWALGYMSQYLHSLDVVALALLTSTAAALISHKIMMIQLHGPLSAWGLIFAWPCLFVFDLLTLMVVHRGLASAKIVYKGLAGVASILLMICSAAFASLYIEGNTELDWSRSVQVLSEWRFFRKLMAQGNSSFAEFFIMYIVVGAASVLLRQVLIQFQPYHIMSISNSFKESNTVDLEIQGPIQRFLAIPLMPLLLFLLIGATLLPPTPWRHLTATLAYDVTTALLAVMKSQASSDGGGCSSQSFLGSHPLGNLKYNPVDDPYYISNLDQPIDEFIASALEGTKFTNIVHIVLESMRDDSFPYQEDGLLHRHITENMQAAEGAPPVNQQTITPFIASLAEHTISWHTMWATVPYTHKAMLAYWCGMIPAPMDWAAETGPPAKWYQHCFPQVLRYMSSATNREGELMDFFKHDRVRRTTDQWETIHIQSSTGEWDMGKELIRGTGMNTMILGEQLSELNGGVEFPSAFGYFDEESFHYLWEYLDYATMRDPKNRMYLSWKTSTTHAPVLLPPEWEEEHYHNYVEKSDSMDQRKYDPIDTWLNGVRWTDDIVKELILGFRERGLENETLFLIHGDHGCPFLGDWRTPVNNPHNEPYRIPFMIYNPLIKNPEKKKIEGNYYALSIPTTVLDLMINTGSFEQQAQQDLAWRFAANYEHAQSLLRPINETIRFFTVDPGAGYWILDNGKNLRIAFELTSDRVRLVDYIVDPLERYPMEMWGGIEALISAGAEGRFGGGTTEFLREAFERQAYMRWEILRRYGLEDVPRPYDIL